MENNVENVETEVVETEVVDEHEGMVQCIDCGEWVPEDEAHVTSDGDYVCNDCIENYVVCNDCGELVKLDDAHEIYDGNYVCDNCVDDYVECADCNQLVPEDDCTYINSNGGYYVCSDCYNSYDYYYCEDCGEHYHSDDMEYVEVDDAWYCPDCIENHREDERVGGYHDHHDGTYGTKYSLGTENYDSEIFEDGMMYMGIETECSATIGGNESEFLDAMDSITLDDDGNKLLRYERDSSINANNLAGVECISVPCTPEKLYSLEDKIKNAFDKARELGYRSDTDRTGIHIHVSKPKNEEVIDRVLLVLETFKDEVIKVARRHSSNWAKFLSDTVYSNDEKENLKALFYIKRKKNTGDRYMALNLTNRDTIEFRLFRGTLNYKTWFAYVEFIHNIMVQCSDLSKPVTDIKWEDLVKGKFLSEYVVEREITCDKVITDTSYKFVELDNKLRLIRLHKNAQGKKLNKLLKKWARKLTTIDAFKFDRSSRELSMFEYEFENYNNKVRSIASILGKLSYMDVERIKVNSLNTTLSKLDDLIFNENYLSNDLRMDSVDLQEVKIIRDNLTKLSNEYRKLVDKFGSLAEGGDR
jgi:hypothetical protein